MTQKRVRDMKCSCCDAYCRGRQWYNRDTGYGLCAKCAAWLKGRIERGVCGETVEEMKAGYGVEGEHYNVEEATA